MRHHTHAAVEVEGLATADTGSVETVRGTSFTVETAKVFTLLGPNGTVAPTAGTARVAGSTW
jgi:ABC-type multidrug transport system ATPase subunit